MPFGSEQDSLHTKAEKEDPLHALAVADFGNVYFDDDAADGTVTEKGKLVGSGPNVKPDPRVKAIVDQKNLGHPDAN